MLLPRFKSEIENQNSKIVCRGERIRTSDLMVPNQARYRTAPRPEFIKGATVCNGDEYSADCRERQEKTRSS